MEVTKYGYNNGESIITRHQIGNITYFSISRHLIPSKITSDIPWQKIKLITSEAGILPQTHQIKGTVYITQDGIMAFQDIPLIFRFVTPHMIYGHYQWYYDDVLYNNIKDKKLPPHMNNLFSNTFTKHIANSDSVKVVVFQDIPIIDKNITLGKLTTFALSHLISKHTGKSLVGDDVPKNDEDIIKVQSPLSKFDKVISNYEIYTDVYEKDIIKVQNKLDYAIQEIKYKELQTIGQEIALAKNLVEYYQDTMPFIDFNTLILYKTKLKKINKLLASFASKRPI
jgi:hypothetical protein